MEGLITPNTSLIVMSHASNVTGALQPVDEWVSVARQHGIPILLDAAQTAGCVPINLAEIPADLLAFSGHKGLLGPQGVGGLYIREGLSPDPLKCGGTGSASSRTVQPDWMPDKYESGTPNTPGLAGLSAGLDYLLQEGPEKIRGILNTLGAGIIAGLKDMEHVILYGPRDMRRNIGVFSFRIRDMDPADTARRLEKEFGIMTRVGLQCAPCAHRAIGTFPEGTVRASLSCLTTEEEVKRFLEAIGDTRPGSSRALARREAAE
jgi:selenocysteine lyase/cysteine desulfurase